MHYLLAHPKRVRDHNQLRALEPVQIGLHCFLEALCMRSVTFQLYTKPCT